MKTAFAVEIEFSGRGISPAEYENRVIKRCLEVGLKFEGFVLPFAGNRSKIELSCEETGLTKVYNLRHFLDGSINGEELKRNETTYTKEIEEICSKAGKEFHGWDGEYKGQETKCKVLCVEHNKYLKPKISRILDGSHKLGCSECAKAARLKGCFDGKEHDEVMEHRVSVAKRIVERKGYVYNGMTEWLGSRKTYVKAYCLKHSVEWETRYSSFVGSRKTCTCPECHKEFRLGMLKREYSGDVNFYIQLLDDKFVKFGITSRDVKTRMKEQSGLSIFEHKLIFEHTFNPGWLAQDLENEIKFRFNCRAVNINDMRDGWSETIMIEDLPNLQQMVYDYMTNLPEEAGMWVSPKDKFNEDTFELTEHFYGVTDPHPQELWTEEQLEAALNAL
ncbi:hypothetical protein LAB19_001675 [Salmonella enterica subsp. enterica serovar Manhattan]|nr:hypothetical protein [Salmonella enterica subsp. enterica serovar Manhattan]